MLRAGWTYLSMNLDAVQWAICLVTGRSTDDAHIDDVVQYIATGSNLKFSRNDETDPVLDFIVGTHTTSMFKREVLTVNHMLNIWRAWRLIWSSPDAKLGTAYGDRDIIAMSVATAILRGLLAIEGIGSQSLADVGRCDAPSHGYRIANTFMWFVAASTHDAYPERRCGPKWQGNSSFGINCLFNSNYIRVLPDICDCDCVEFDGGASGDVPPGLGDCMSLPSGLTEKDVCHDPNTFEAEY